MIVSFFRKVVGFLKLVFGLVFNLSDDDGNKKPNPNKRAERYDFFLEFANGVDTDQYSSASDTNGNRNKHRIASGVLDRLRENGLELRRVQPSVAKCQAFALRGKYEVLLRQAEKMKLRKVLKEGKEKNRSALFSISRAKDFLNAENELKFFCSGERLLLLEDLVVNDPYIRQAQGFIDFRVPDDDVDDTLDEGPRKRKSSAKSQNISLFGSRKRPVKVISELFPLHDHHEIDQLARNWIKTPWSQPIDRIKDYLGHSRAFYFAFIGAYTFWLVPAALLGIWVFRIQQNDHGFANPGTILYGVFLAVWTTSFLEYWKRRQAKLAFNWDTFGFEEEEEEERAEYRERAKPMYHEIAGEHQWVYPGYKRVFAMLLSFFVCGGLSVLATLTMFYFLYLNKQAQQEWKGEEWEGIWAYAIHAPMMAYMMSISVFSSLNSILAETLTNWENHRTLSEHQNALVIKLVTLQFCNFFVSLFYVAFFEMNLDKLSASLMALLGFHQVVGQVVEIGTPLFQAVAHAAKVVQQKKKRKTFASNHLPAVGRTDLLLAKQDDLYMEYLELWIQFGQVTLFSMIFPLAALLALVNNVIEIRTDAFKMLRIERRSIPQRASGIGSWVEIFEVLAYIAVMTNVALVGLIFAQTDLAEELLAGWSTTQRLLLLVGVEHLIVALKAMIAIAVPDLSSELLFLLRSRKAAHDREQKEDFDLKTYCQELLRKDIKQYAYRDSSDQARQLLKNSIHEEEDSVQHSMLFQWLMDQNDRRRRAEKFCRYYKHKVDAVSSQANLKFSDFAQFLNIAIACAGVILLFTKEARLIEYF